jgi:muconate cycloisomerase
MSECSASDALARRAGLEPLSSVPVAALVDALTADVPEGVTRFGTVKVKVGIRSPGEDCARVARLRSRLGPNVRIRIDVNGAWSADQVAAFLDGIDPGGIEMIEQPIPPGDVDALARIRHLSPVPIVADESCTSVADVETLAREGAVDGVVVDVQGCGGPAAALDVCLAARAAGMFVHVRSNLGGVIDTYAALHLAAAVRADGAVGIGANLVRPPISAGPGPEARVQIPGPGLGVEPGRVSRWRVA